MSIFFSLLVGMVFWGMIILFFSFLSLSSSSWVMMWVMLELVLFLMIIIMNKTNSMFYTESSIKYFLIQAGAGLILLLSGVLVLLLKMDSFLFLISLYIGLFLKLGIFPLHFWVVPVFSNSDWMSIFLLSGPMKVIPLGILVSIVSSFSFGLVVVFFLALLTSLMGALMGNNMSKLSMMVASSSISHTGWMVLSVIVGGLLFYFSVYMINMFFFINSIFSGGLELSLMLLSLSGVPPFVLFFGKLMIILYILNVMPLLWILGFLLASILSLNFYLKFSFSSYFTKVLVQQSWKSTFIFLGLSGLFLISLVIY